MKEEDKTHIDDLFREGLNDENIEIPFQEDGWKKLEDRLDRYDRRKGVMVWLRPLAGVAALLLLAFAGWWLWPEKKQVIQEPVVVEQEITKSEKEHGVESRQTEHSISVVEGQQDENPEEDKKRVFESSSLAGREKIIIAEIDEGESERKSKMRLIASRGEIPGLVENSADLSSTNLDPVRFMKEAPPPVKTRKLPEPLKLEDEPSLNMALTVLAAPAYNGVNNLNNAKIGGDFGVLFSVALGNRWRVSTGTIYGLKLYETDGDNYNPDTNGSYNNSPKSVYADCRVLDVPLNIDYKLLDFQKVTFSLGTGVSTYFMLSEKYSYQFEYGPEQKNAVSLKNNSIHWASVLNLQASLERQLSPQISVSLRPYLKVPFQDIGYGRVRLQSFGVALGTSFNF